MVENPASAVGADIAARAKEEDASTDRVSDLAAKGMRDPASLQPEEIKELCAALLARTGNPDA